MKTMRKLLECLREAIERDIDAQDIDDALREVEALLIARPNDSALRDVLRTVIVGCGMVMGSPPKSAAGRSRYANPSLDEAPPFGHHSLLLALEKFFGLLESESIFWTPEVYEEVSMVIENGLD